MTEEYIFSSDFMLIQIHTCFKQITSSFIFENRDLSTILDVFQTRNNELDSIYQSRLKNLKFFSVYLPFYLGTYEGLTNFKLFLSLDKINKM